jgi:two-component sensor histidine kinase
LSETPWMEAPVHTLKRQNAYLIRLLEQAGLDSEQRDIAARVQTVFTDELHHRMKNLLAMVTAIVRQSIRSADSLAEAENAIGTRLIAMAKAHDLLLKSDWQSADLAMVIQGAIEQHNHASGRIVVQGEDIEVAAATILPLSLLFNELCTNAAKYGALSRDSGLVTLSWAPSADGKSLILRWVESGGPTVTQPGVRSFGTRLIETGIPHQFGGEGHLRFPPSGAEFEVIVPLARIRPVLPGPPA